jgi:hypothetical protein
MDTKPDSSMTSNSSADMEVMEEKTKENNVSHSVISVKKLSSKTRVDVEDNCITLYPHVDDEDYPGYFAPWSGRNYVPVGFEIDIPVGYIGLVEMIYGFGEARTSNGISLEKRIYGPGIYSNFVLVVTYNDSKISRRPVVPISSKFASLYIVKNDVEIKIS